MTVKSPAEVRDAAVEQATAEVVDKANANAKVNGQ